ncbi:hypothetical protein [Desulfobacula sp.]|uniref:hypothetical protein n=1 Tax=Desulfobacula sp. TaxID=2593537 RepID=UPI0026243673|nr:hypothetical protein [Desulfobacula sp.]
MKKIIGGSIAIILGLSCFFAFFPAFLNLLAGIIPLILILAGCLTIYLNYESKPPECGEATDCWNNSAITDKPTDDIPNLLGNTGSHVFHSLDCQYSKSKKCTAVFNTREEALLEGYKPCGICKP